MFLVRAFQAWLAGTPLDYGQRMWGGSVAGVSGDFVFVEVQVQRLSVVRFGSFCRLWRGCSGQVVHLWFCVVADGFRAGCLVGGCGGARGVELVVGGVPPVVVVRSRSKSVVQ